MKFSDGEWLIDSSRLKTAINCGSKHICMVNHFNLGPDNPETVQGEEHDANCRLIASAPEMYKLIEKYEQAMFLGNVAEDDPEAWIEYINKINEIQAEFPKILAKIRGE